MKKDKIYLVSSGFDKLTKELKKLISENRKNVIQEIKEAREQGDLSENAEYDSAKQKQSIIEARIREINQILKNAIILDDENIDEDRKTVRINSIVVLLNLSTNERFQIKIGTISELDVNKKIISNRSPIAKSIMGHGVDEEVVVKGIRQIYSVKILEIK